MLLLLFARELAVPIPQAVVDGCAIFNFPALSLFALIKTFHFSRTVELLSAMALLLAWSAFIAWFFWRAVGTFQGDDEPDDRRGQYDWAAFRLRFVIGFGMGSLVGWRFVRFTTSMKTLLIASLVTGCIGGFIFGISRPPDFWSRP
jgi:hypothetical protein